MLTDLKRTKYLGKGVTLFPMVKIVNPKCVDVQQNLPSLAQVRQKNIFYSILGI